ncbi:hypothetical protein KR026_004778 [Drosophila bipectinata]|nr:hypothetical protein KR026_004778 [Drosophila bipectinata]
MDAASESIGFTLTQLKEIIETKGLTRNLRFFNKKKSLFKQVKKLFHRMITGIIYWERDRVHVMMSALLVIALMEEEGVDAERNQQYNLIKRFLVFVNCQSPMSVHLLMERVIEELDSMNLSSDANLLYLSVVLANSCERARPLAVCMLWQLLARRLPGIKITMHRYRELSELAEGIALNRPEMPDEIMLDESADEDLRQEVESDREFRKAKLLVLLEAIENLLRLVLEADNTDLKEFGYPNHFFELERKDAASLYMVCLGLVQKVPDDEDTLHTKLHNVLCNLSEILVKCLDLQRNSSTTTGDTNRPLVINDDQPTTTNNNPDTMDDDKMDTSSGPPSPDTTTDI